MTGASNGLFLLSAPLAVFLPMFFIRLGQIAAAIEALATDAPEAPKEVSSKDLP